MCLSASNVKAEAQWNWEGDTIIHSPIIIACREVPGTKKRYDIDIRDFIASKNNAVLSRTVGKIADMLTPDDRTLFFSRQRHSFDFRLRAVTAYLSENIAYEAKENAGRKYDYWLFPDETLRIKKGDCEDRAFLLASLLLASGISSYSVRVVLGKIYNQATRKSYDHIWVMYKNESGVWMLVEPLLHTTKARVQAQSIAKQGKKRDTEQVEYVPYFVFNDTHLWKLKNNTTDLTFENYLGSRTFWKKYDPKFAAGVHNHIFDAALPNLSWIDLLYVKGISLAMDINPVIYDPRDHFDNGFVDEGWQLVDERIGEGTLDGLAKAAHAAADFYAHSSYGYFAKINTVGRMVVFDHKNPSKCFETAPDFSQGGFAFTKFSANQSKCDSTARQKAILSWNEKKNISGRFGQPGDQAQGFLEKVGITIPYKYRSAQDYAKRTCLPHHDEIAVDDEKKPAKHKLYADPEDFKKAFQLRKEAAIEHIGKLYDEWIVLKKKNKTT